MSEAIGYGGGPFCASSRNSQFSAFIRCVMNFDVRHIPAASLKKYEGNPRKHPAAQIEALQKSISEFGFVSPVLVDGNNEIIAGHGKAGGSHCPRHGNRAGDHT